MPTHEIIPQAVKVAVEGHDNVTGRPIVMTFGVGCTSAATSSDLSNIANAFKNHLTNQLSLFSGSVTWDQCVATALDSATAPQVVVPLAQTGTAGDYYPNMAGVIEFKTLTRGRSYRGKVYVPIPAAQTTASTGTASSTWLGNVITAINAVDTALNGLANASALVVLSRKLDLGSTITSLIGRSILGFIRRRLEG